MAGLLRAFVVVLIALVATWSGAQAAGTGIMPHDVTGLMVHDSDAAAPPHCQDCDPCCPDDSCGLLCQVACVAPTLADLTVAVDPGPAELVSTLHAPTAATGLHGRSDPPDPFPPRILLT